MPGYVLSLEGTDCISMDAHNSQSDASEEDDEFMQAMHYGLEHHPFRGTERSTHLVLTWYV